MMFLRDGAVNENRWGLGQHTQAAIRKGHDEYMTQTQDLSATTRKLEGKTAVVAAGAKNLGGLVSRMPGSGGDEFGFAAGKIPVQRTTGHIAIGDDLSDTDPRHAVTSDQLNRGFDQPFSHTRH